AGWIRAGLQRDATRVRLMSNSRWLRDEAWIDTSATVEMPIKRPAADRTAGRLSEWWLPRAATCCHLLGTLFGFAVLNLIRELDCRIPIHRLKNLVLFFGVRSIAKRAALAESDLLLATFRLKREGFRVLTIDRPFDDRLAVIA